MIFVDEQSGDLSFDVCGGNLGVAAKIITKKVSTTLQLRTQEK